MSLDTQTVVAIGTAVATVILSLAPLIRAFREPLSVRPADAPSAAPAPIAVLA